MRISRRTASTAIAAMVVLLAGCLSGAGGGGATTPSPSTATGTPSTPTTGTPSSSQTGCAEWVSFWGLGGPGETHWSPDRVLIGYTLSANASVLFVAYEGDAVLGVAGATTGEHAVTADGDRVPLDRRLSGSHTIRVVAHADANRNGRFEPGTDPPCRSDGGVVEAGPRTIDFGPFAGNGTAIG